MKQNTKNTTAIQKKKYASNGGELMERKQEAANKTIRGGGARASKAKLKIRKQEGYVYLKSRKLIDRMR